MFLLAAFILFYCRCADGLMTGQHCGLTSSVSKTTSNPTAAES